MKKENNYWILKKLIDAIIYTIIIWVALFLIIYDSAVVYNVSMQPTLNSDSGLDNDIVYYNTYKGYDYGDIVIIETDNELVIKRVIAKGGDKIRYSYNSETNIYDLVLNDQIMLEDYIKEQVSYAKLINSNNPSKYIDLNDQSGYNPFGLLKKNQPNNFDENENYIVPNGQVFVLGDNRLNSTDSKTHGGYEVKNIKGVVELIVPKGENVFINLLGFLF